VPRETASRVRDRIRPVTRSRLRPILVGAGRVPTTPPSIARRSPQDRRADRGAAAPDMGLPLPPEQGRAASRHARARFTSVSLIEHLHHDGWAEHLRRSFEVALDILSHDRFRRCSSSVDDIRSWLVVGGVSRVKEHLRRQTEDLRFPDERRKAIDEYVDELARDHQRTLLDLVGRGIITSPSEEVWSFLGLVEGELEDMVARASQGEQPFLERMRALGCSDDEINTLLGIVDRWLARTGMAPVRDTTDMN
jgi:hypothetical protein